MSASDQAQAFITAANAVMLAVGAYVAMYVRSCWKTSRMAGDDAAADAAWQRDTLPPAATGAAAADWAFQPVELARGVVLRNRFIKAATFESAARGGVVSDALIRFHVDQCAHVGMTTVAYGCVAGNGLTHTTGSQLMIDGSAACRAGLSRLTHAVHAAAEGAKVSMQLTHAGLMAEEGDVVGPSRQFSLGAMKFARGLSPADIADLVQAFGAAARVCADCGFDAVEVHCGHGYLLSQFISPVVNARSDAFGGSVEARSRFAVEVVRAVRAAVGGGVPVLVKMNLLDVAADEAALMREVGNAAAFSRLVFAAGADVVVPSAGLILENGISMMRGPVPRLSMVARSAAWGRKVGLALCGPFFVGHVAYRPTFLLKPAVELVGRIMGGPVTAHQRPSNRVWACAYIGGVATAADVALVHRTRAFHVICVARALLRDAAWPLAVAAELRGEAPPPPLRLSDMEDGAPDGCDHCNRCIVAQMAGAPTQCHFRKIHV
jgi:2,4-dienoyl-CoA reductase-like NADH-dependent reductase (Old Yellow Enzyme family)